MNNLLAAIACMLVVRTVPLWAEDYSHKQASRDQEHAALEAFTLYLASFSEFTLAYSWHQPEPDFSLEGTVDVTPHGRRFVVEESRRGKRTLMHDLVFDNSRWRVLKRNLTTGTVESVTVSDTQPRSAAFAVANPLEPLGLYVKSWPKNLAELLTEAPTREAWTNESERTLTFRITDGSGDRHTVVLDVAHSFRLLRYAGEKVGTVPRADGSPLIRVIENQSFDLVEGLWCPTEARMGYRNFKIGKPDRALGTMTLRNLQLKSALALSEVYAAEQSPDVTHADRRTQEVRLSEREKQKRDELMKNAVSEGKTMLESEGLIIIDARDGPSNAPYYVLLSCVLLACVVGVVFIRRR